VLCCAVLCCAVCCDVVWCGVMWCVVCGVWCVVWCSYAEAFVGVVSQFQTHFRQKGWNSTKFQIYLNNKPNWSPNTGVWSLDEPVDFLDFVGLGYYMDLFRMGLGLPPSAPFAAIPAQRKVQTTPETDASSGAAFDTRIDVSTRFVQHKGVLNSGRKIRPCHAMAYRNTAQYTTPGYTRPHHSLV
jgi:hypothetical protein